MCRQCSRFRRRSPPVDDGLSRDSVRDFHSIALFLQQNCTEMQQQFTLTGPPHQIDAPILQLLVPYRPGHVLVSSIRISLFRSVLERRACSSDAADIESVVSQVRSNAPQFVQPGHLLCSTIGTESCRRNRNWHFRAIIRLLPPRTWCSNNEPEVCLRLPTELAIINERRDTLATRKFIWSICNLLRGPYKRNEYRKVILPLTVLRRFDCLLAPTKAEVLREHAAIKAKPENVVRSLLEKITQRPFYNLAKLDFARLLDDPNQLAPNLNAYINGFSKNVRDIMDRFDFDQQITRMAEKNLLYEVVKAFSRVDLSPERVDNVQMGYVFEELIRIGAEQANEEAGEHLTPREVIRLMVNLLLSPEQDLRRSHVVKTIYDPACGTGGMLSVSEAYIRKLNKDAKPLLFGQDWNDEAWAVCKSDMLIKGKDADNIRRDDTFTKDGFDCDAEGKKIQFDYMLANPPFGVEWKQQARFIEQEAATLGYEGRFGAGLPRINDGSLLFLQHMLSKRRAPKEGGSRIGIVFNGSAKPK